MKKILRLVAFSAVAGLMVFASCKKEDESPSYKEGWDNEEVEQIQSACKMEYPDYAEDCECVYGKIPTEFTKSELETLFNSENPSLNSLNRLTSIFENCNADEFFNYLMEDEESEIVEENNSNTMSAIVDGIKLEACNDCISTVSVQGSSSILFNDNNTNESIMITLPEKANEGTYDLAEENGSFYASYSKNTSFYSTLSDNSSGSITISSIEYSNGLISEMDATFNFSTGGVNVTNGIISFTQTQE